MTIEAQARAIVGAWRDRCLPLDELLSDERHAWLVESLTIDITTALRAQWEAAARYLDEEAKRFIHIDDGEAYMIQQFAKHCRQRAQGGGG